jgi:hypothetical protein
MCKEYLTGVSMSNTLEKKSPARAGLLEQG